MQGTKPTQMGSVSKCERGAGNRQEGLQGGCGKARTGLVVPAGMAPVNKTLLYLDPTHTIQ